MANNSLREIQTVHVHYEQINGEWIADTQTDGLPFELVGYQNKNLQDCKIHTKEGLDVYFDGKPYKLIETIEPQK